MLCRSQARAEACRDEIVQATGNANVHVLVGDVSLEADVRRCWEEFAEHSGGAAGVVPRLDVLICNAGALQNEKTLTSEGVEVTFASHLLFGTYLLGMLAMPSLEATPESKLLVVSSGGMYNTCFPDWEVATSTSQDPSVTYDGQFAYAYAKRGQVLLCERWAAAHPRVTVVSCHPGWTETPAVTAAYGDSQKYLQPLRTPWQGAEGMVWLCVAPPEKVESGAFYLDRSPQVKHMAGPFFTEGSYTKNSKASVDAMMQKLKDWTNGQRPGDLSYRSEAMVACKDAKRHPLRAMERAIELERFMGKWYVNANIPTRFDKGTVNNVEEYEYDAERGVIHVSFTYYDAKLTKAKRLQQRARVANAANTQWKLSPKLGFYLPVSIPYLIADCDADYSSCIIGVPDRSYIWIMTRTPSPEPAVLEGLVRKAQVLGFDITKLKMVRQEWGCESEMPEAEDQGWEEAHVGA